METKGLNRFCVVASAKSAAGFKPPKGVSTIAVNGAIDRCQCQYWFTLDPSPENMHRMFHQKPGVEYYAAVSPDWKLPNRVKRLKRIARPTNKRIHPRTPKQWFDRLGCIDELSDNPKEINTGNSVWGALQLARHLGADRVLLVGVDADQNNKLDGKKPYNLSHLSLLFKGAVGVIEFANVGKMQVDGMPRFDTQAEGIAWLMQ